MVESNIDNESGEGQIVVCPNKSLHWHETKKYLWIIGAMIFFVAAIMAFLGAWYVLPFAGLEVIVVVSLMLWVSHQCHRKQVITFRHNRIQVEKGYGSPNETWESEIFFTRLKIDKPMYRGHLCKIFLRSKDQKLEVGEFLNEDDKKRLISELQSVISVVK